MKQFSKEWRYGTTLLTLLLWASERRITTCAWPEPALCILFAVVMATSLATLSWLLKALWR